jgi:hypothetical protein
MWLIWRDSLQRLEVENKISMRWPSTNAARWDINKDEGKITLFLPFIWKDAEEQWENKHDKKILDGEYTPIHDEVIPEFIGDMVYYYLMERVCIERAHEKVRMKRNKCHPCAVQPVIVKIHKYIKNVWKWE